MHARLRHEAIRQPGGELLDYPHRPAAVRPFPRRALGYPRAEMVAQGMAPSSRESSNCTDGDSPETRCVQIGATRRLLNFSWPASRAGKPSCGGELMSEGRYWNESPASSVSRQRPSRFHTTPGTFVRRSFGPSHSELLLARSKAFYLSKIRLNQLVDHGLNVGGGNYGLAHLARRRVDRHGNEC
jgi:hypothetical protein